MRTTVLCRVFCVLLFLAWTAEPTGDPVPYTGLWHSPFWYLFGSFFESLPGIHLSPWQVLVLLLVPVCLAWPGAFRRRAHAMDAAVLTALVSICLTFAWGLVRDGSAYQAYYQLWRFVAALVVGVLLLCVVRTSRDLKALGTALVAAALVRAMLGLYFYVVYVRGGRVPSAPGYMTTHEDSLLFVAGILVVTVWALARARPSAWLAMAVATPVLLWAIIVNQRRIAWLELALALSFAIVLLPRGRLRRRVTLFLGLAAPAVALYVLVGWGRHEAIFEPLRAFSTSGSHEDSSSLARLEEIRNLLFTLSEGGNPLLGRGWGHPYLKATSVYANFDSTWSQYIYLPHNSLLGIAAFGGLVGLFGIWLVIPVAAFLATRGLRASIQPIDRAAAMAAICILPAYGAHCYGDLGLQSLTCGLILSQAIAVAGKVSSWGSHPGSERDRRNALPARGRLQGRTLDRTLDPSPLA